MARSKSDIRKIWSAAKEARLWASEAAAKAADAMADDDVILYANYMAVHARLIMVSARRIKEARAAEVE